MELKDTFGNPYAPLDGKSPWPWPMKHHRYRRFACPLAIAMLLIISGLVRGQTESKAKRQSPAPASAGSPEAAAADIWQKLTTRCSIPGSAKSATFYEDTKTDLLFRMSHRIFELRDARVQYKPDFLSEADKLNGIQAHGFGDLYYSAFRGMEVQTRPHQVDLTPPLPPHGWSQFRAIGLLFRPLRLKMEKRTGQWAYAGWNAFDNEFDLNAVARSKSSCAVLTSADPFADAAERDRMASAKANEAARKVADQQAETRRKLFTNRELGNALVCDGAKLRTALEFDSGPTIARAFEVKIIGASDNGGVLDEWVRVQPVEDQRNRGLPEAFYFARVTDLQDQCRNSLSRTPPGMLSGSALAEGVRAAGSVEAWPEYHKRAENATKSKLNADALTSDEFTTKLTDAVRRRGAELGEDPADYPAVIERVSSAVRLCASMYSASLDNLGIPRFNRQDKYSVCFGGMNAWLPAPGSSFVWRMSIRGLQERWQKEERNWFGPKLLAEVWLYPKTENPFDKKFILLSSDIKDNSATQAADAPPPTASPLARPSSVRTGQQVVKVCANAKLFASPPIGLAAQGSGTVLGTAEEGDQGIILQRGQRVSRIEFEVSGRKLAGWLTNNALCPAP